MLCNVLCSARESLHAAHSAVASDSSEVLSLPEVGDLSEVGSMEEAEELCTTHLSQLNDCLVASWDWFYKSVISHVDMTLHLATLAHQQNMAYSSETMVSHDHPFFKNASGIMDTSCLSAVALRIRRSLCVPMVCYCKENVETTLNGSVVFIEPPSWPALEGGTIPLVGEASSLDSLPGTAPGLKGFSRYIRPYLMDSLPGAGRGHRTPGIHLVVCVHGLQGNQFDLRLYRIFLTMALPQVRFSFLMSSSNQGDTFCDFNLMTDRLLEEVLDHVRDMPTPPSKVSFIGHSLGSITVRSLVTRPEFSNLIPKLHLYLSICGPHLGTKYQNGIISVGMWAVRKWYNSKSLLQLSLKDAPNPMDSFLYHLSEAPSLKYFRHVVLLASPQDKYVPYHSAKISTLTSDAAFQTSISLRIMQNILEPLRKAHVNLVRISVDHAIPTSTNSVIGRAAHIAMLDNDLFIRKLVSLHLAQYFIEA
jgi:predicted alpha/beta hydrolase family esterase